MGLFSKLFSSDKIDCPRCLGKGIVSSDDIKRLKKEAFWDPGQCAYCNGKGTVQSTQVEALDPDTAYLTTDLSASERRTLKSGDPEAKERARIFEADINDMVSEIEHQYYIENQEPAEIADYFFKKYHRNPESAEAKQEVVEYIQRVINSKLGRL